MYLADFQLTELCEKQGLVSPYDPTRVNPASIDLTLGRDFVNLSEKEVHFVAPLDTPEAKGLSCWFVAKSGERFQASSVKLEPGIALLATTAERVKIPDTQIVVNRQGFPAMDVGACIGELRLKSSAARNGLDHALAGWIDPGFDGTLTLELHSHRPIELIAGKAYVQLVVAAMLAAPSKSYQQTGRYTGEHAQGAVLSRG